MHLLTLPTEIDMGIAGRFPAGQILMEDVNAAEMMLMFAGRGITATAYKPTQKGIEIGAPTSVLVAGTLAFGDAIMLTPVLRRLKEMGNTVYVACPLHTRAALLNLSYIDGFENWPLRPETVDGYREVCFLEGFQHHPKARTHHQTDVFADMCCLDPIYELMGDYLPTPEELEWARTTFPRYEGRKRIGIQVQASMRCRTYHGAQLRKVMDLLLKDGWELYMMGKPGEFGCQEIGHIHDASKHAPMFRQSAAFLTTCDAFLGPDSGFLHVAGALEIPSVGLFSVFPWQLRTSQYPSVFAIQAAGNCAPCFHTRNNLQPHFPVGGPCNKTGYCTVLSSIEPERVVQKILQQATRPRSQPNTSP